MEFAVAAGLGSAAVGEVELQAIVGASKLTVAAAEILAGLAIEVVAVADLTAVVVDFAVTTGVGGSTLRAVIGPAVAAAAEFSGTVAQPLAGLSSKVVAVTDLIAGGDPVATDDSFVVVVGRRIIAAADGTGHQE